MKNGIWNTKIVPLLQKRGVFNIEKHLFFSTQYISKDRLL